MIDKNKVDKIVFAGKIVNYQIGMENNLENKLKIMKKNLYISSLKQSN
jgi:hypothetical protein